MGRPARGARTGDLHRQPGMCRRRLRRRGASPSGPALDHVCHRVQGLALSPGPSGTVDAHLLPRRRSRPVRRAPAVRSVPTRCVSQLPRGGHPRRRIGSPARSPGSESSSRRRASPGGARAGPGQGPDPVDERRGSAAGGHRDRRPESWTATASRGPAPVLHLRRLGATAAAPNLGRGTRAHAADLRGSATPRLRSCLAPVGSSRI